MVRVIMRGCNGRMGRVISGLLAEDREACLVAGIDLVDDGHNPYPVYKDIRDCDVEADCMIDFLPRRHGMICWIIVWRINCHACFAPQG